MKKSITSTMHQESTYRKEHRVLMAMYEMYHNSELAAGMSFSEYFDSLMRLDSARHNHEIHNFFKTEHSLQENFSLEEWDDDNDVI